jgi:hypothetical protein
MLLMVFSLPIVPVAPMTRSFEVMAGGLDGIDLSGRRKAKDNDESFQKRINQSSFKCIHLVTT